MVITAILTHQPSALVKEMVKWWTEVVGATCVLVAYGGSKEHFADLDPEFSVYIADPRLRTKDHQRERQSYGEVFRKVSAWVKARGGVTEILFLEFDCIPLVPQIFRILDEKLAAEDADMIGCHLERIDKTNHPHWLNHVHTPGFENWLSSFSVRDNPRVCLSMLGSFSYWKTEAFHGVAAVEEPEPFYLELVIPTIAHHLGFRVRNLPELGRYVVPAGNWLGRADEVRRNGAWMLHPVKGVWEASAAGQDLAPFLGSRVLE